jgi:hypothetical protein
MSTAEQPRPTPTQAFRELAMAHAQRKPSEPESSVSLTRNAKGHVQFEVVVRDPDPERAESLATFIFNGLAAAYPYPVTNGGTE